MYEFGVLLGECVLWVGGKWCQGEMQKCMDIQCVGFVVGIELIVFVLVFSFVYYVVVDEEVFLFVVVVGGDEGVIEVEEGQIYGV